jgi:hypothetical protein
MKKPELLVTAHSGAGALPTEGTCTSCPNEKFRIKVPDNLDRADALKSLQRQFDQHFKRIHIREDASQAAARIVREATEDH